MTDKISIELLRESATRFRDPAGPTAGNPPVRPETLLALLDVAEAAHALIARELKPRGLSAWGHYLESAALHVALAPFDFGGPPVAA